MPRPFAALIREGNFDPCAFGTVAGPQPAVIAASANHAARKEARRIEGEAFIAMVPLPRHLGYSCP